MVVGWEAKAISQQMKPIRKNTLKKKEREREREKEIWEVSVSVVEEIQKMNP